MKYNFDEIIDRRGTNSIKFDGIAGDAGIPADCIPMWIADMDFATPEPILNAMRARLDKRILGYSDYYDPAFLAAVAGWMKRRFDWDVAPDSFVFSGGVVRTINACVEHLTAPGDGVILMTPAYHPFGDAIARFHRQPVYSKLIDNDGYYMVDFADFERKAKDPKNKLFFLCSPQNPTGRVWSASELARIGEICFQNDVFVVSDEIHADLVRTGVEHIPFAKLFPNEKRLVTCTAPSKTFNIAGNQLANIVIPDAALREKWHDEEWTGIPNPLSIDAATAAYNECERWLEELKRYIDKNFQFMRDYLARYLPKARMRIPEGTYLAWVDFSALHLPDETLRRKIHEAGVYAEFAGEFVAHDTGRMRLNIACPRAVLEEGLRRIVLALQD